MSQLQVIEAIKYSFAEGKTILEALKLLKKKGFTTEDIRDVFESFTRKELLDFFKELEFACEQFNHETLDVFWKKYSDFFPAAGQFYPIFGEFETNRSLFKTFLWYTDEMLKGPESTFETSHLSQTSIDTYKRQQFLCQVWLLLLEFRESEIRKSNKQIRKILFSALKSSQISNPSQISNHKEVERLKNRVEKKLKEMKISEDKFFSVLTDRNREEIWVESMQQNNDSDEKSVFNAVYQRASGLLPDAFDENPKSIPSSKKTTLRQNLQLAIEGIHYSQMRLKELEDEDRSFNNLSSNTPLTDLQRKQEDNVERLLKYYLHMEDLYLRFIMNLLLLKIE
jgi:hypothetical protein